MASRAARSARAGSAPSFGASQAASAAMRSTFCATLPSLAWKMIGSRLFTRSSSGVLRSWSQKNLASDRRARSTRSLPAITVAPPSLVSMLATTAKRGASLPSASSRAK